MAEFVAFIPYLRGRHAELAKHLAWSGYRRRPGAEPGKRGHGIPPGRTHFTAAMHVTDPTAAQAQLDLTTAYL